YWTDTINLSLIRNELNCTDKIYNEKREEYKRKLRTNASLTNPSTSSPQIDYEAIIRKQEAELEAMRAKVLADQRKEDSKLQELSELLHKQRLQQAANNMTNEGASTSQSSSSQNEDELLASDDEDRPIVLPFVPANGVTNAVHGRFGRYEPLNPSIP